MTKAISTTLFTLLTVTVFAQAPGGGAIPYQGNSKTNIQAPVKQSACNPAFFDGFESGNTNNFTLINGTKTASTANPAFGTYCMELTSTVSSHYQGVNHVFTNALTPSHISLYMRSGNANQYGPYFVIGDDNVSSNNGLAFVYFQYNASVINVQTGSGNFTTPYVQDQWYHIEYKDINWTNKTADVYVDNVLLADDFNFFFNGTASLTNMHMWGWSGAISRYDSIAIDPGQGPVITIDSTQQVNCFGDSTGAIFTTTTGGFSPYDYSWNNGETTDDIAGIPAGNYQLVVTDTSGCIDSTSVTITEPTELTGAGIATDETVNSNDGSIDLTATGGTPPYTYLWSNSDTTEDIDSLTGGTYTVTVTDSLGCEDVIEIIVGSAVGVSEVNIENNFSIYPNPASQLISVIMLKPTAIVLHNALGKQVMKVAANSTTANIDISQLATGVYYLQVGKQVKKLVIQ